MYGPLLGQKTEYKDKYDKNLLYPISRAPLREKIEINGLLPFQGYDIWNCYELSWLDDKGKPQIRILEFYVDAESVNLIESKSMKLYLNSFHNTKFSNEEEVLTIIKNDLSIATGSIIEAKIKTLESYLNKPLTLFTGDNLDLLDVNIEKYEYDANLLEFDENEQEVTEVLSSNLLKANCLVTGQPDWGSIQINYRGPKISKQSLLKYLISFRNQNEFAEPCCERIFMDIINKCKSKDLTIYVRFTRRGGIDINSIRTTGKINYEEIVNSRHVRQ